MKQEFGIDAGTSHGLVVESTQLLLGPSTSLADYQARLEQSGLATVAGLLIHGFWVHRKRDYAAYQPSFSGDEFGCLVECSPDKVGRAQEVLRDAGCAEVRVLAD